MGVSGEVSVEGETPSPFGLAPKLKIGAKLGYAQDPSTAVPVARPFALPEGAQPLGLVDRHARNAVLMHLMRAWEAEQTCGKLALQESVTPEEKKAWMESLSVPTREQISSYFLLTGSAPMAEMTVDATTMEKSIGGLVKARGVPINEKAAFYSILPSLRLTALEAEMVGASSLDVMYDESSLDSLVGRMVNARELEVSFAWEKISGQVKIMTPRTTPARDQLAAYYSLTGYLLPYDADAATYGKEINRLNVTRDVPIVPSEAFKDIAIALRLPPDHPVFKELPDVVTKRAEYVKMEKADELEKKEHKARHSVPALRGF